LFDYLAVGLYLLQDRTPRYPYPPVLEYALNTMAARIGAGFPARFSHVIHIFQTPLRSWWRDVYGQLPLEIDERFPLLEEGREIRLHEQLEEYLSGSELPLSGRVRPNDLLLYQDNQLVVNLLHELRAAYELNPDDAQSAYRTIRAFINTHVFTSWSQLQRTLRLPLYHEKVFAFYESVTHVRDLAMRDGCYLNCPTCGVVVRRNGIDTSPKPTLCAEQCPGDGGWKRIADEDDLCVLKRGVLLRTHIPGQLEMRLHRWLTDEVCPQHPQLDVELYPGVDRYDLLLRFHIGDANVVWAVDAKDHRTPAALSTQLKVDPRPYNLGPWKWSRAYYVIPDYRIRVYPRFIEDVRRAADLPRLNVDIVSEVGFRKAVVAFLQEIEDANV
jgi:hypothetical protein